MDTAGTLRGLTYFVTLLGAAIVALRIAVSERGRFALLGGVAVVCGVTALVVGAHRVLGLTALYGLYEPVQAAPPVLGPLLNPNHLGSLMALGTVLSAGLILYVKQSASGRVFWAINATGCTVVLFATASRGAVLALVAGLGVTLAIAVAQRLAPSSSPMRSARQRFLTSSLPVAVVILSTLFVVVYTSGTNVVDQLENTTLQEIQEPRSKFAVWRSAANLVGESPWVGVGRGAFEPVFTRVHPAAAFVSFSHIENEYVQVLVDYGIPGTVFLTLAFAWLVIVGIRRWRDGPLIAGALGGVAAVAIHSNVDFGVELFGLALPITLVAATLSYVPIQEISPSRILRTRAVRLLHLVALAGAVVVLLLPITSSVEEDHRTLEQRPRLAEVQDIIARHPLDYYGYGVAAEILSRKNDPDAVRLLNHALELHPTQVGLHRMAARMLVRAGRPKQAQFEYSTALRGSVDPEPLLREILSSFPPNEAALAIPIDYTNVESILKSLADLKHGDVALLWLSHVIEQRPRDLRVAERLFESAMSAGDLDRAELAARRRVELVPSLQARVALGGVLKKRDNYAEVVKVLADVASWRGHGRKDEIAAGWILLCDAHIALHQRGDSIRCLHLLDGADVLDSRGHAQVLRRLDEVNKSDPDAKP
jgi:O-antigen ligase